MAQESNRNVEIPIPGVSLCQQGSRTQTTNEEVFSSCLEGFLAQGTKPLGPPRIGIAWD